jgi:hypothetical protein
VDAALDQRITSTLKVYVTASARAGLVETGCMVANLPCLTAATVVHGVHGLRGSQGTFGGTGGPEGEGCLYVFSYCPS